jgi:hypothetical protein
MSSPATIPREIQAHFDVMTANLQGYNDMEAKLKCLEILLDNY